MAENFRARQSKEPKKKTAKLSKIDAQIEALLKERETEIIRIREDEHKQDTRRKILAGQAVLKEALRREPVKRFLYNLLSKDLTRPGDRALFDDLMEEWGMPPLPPLPSVPPTSASSGPVNDKSTDDMIPETDTKP
jgi:hypothetical protein